MDLSELFLTQSDGQAITLTQDLSHLLSVSEPAVQSELGRNFINPDSGLRLLADGGVGGHEGELLVSQQTDAEEGGNNLEAVNPSLIVLGAVNAEEITARRTVITKRMSSKK